MTRKLILEHDCLPGQLESRTERLLEFCNHARLNNLTLAAVSCSRCTNTLRLPLKINRQTLAERPRPYRQTKVA